MRLVTNAATAERRVFLFATERGRSLRKPVVARSAVSFRLKTAADFAKCLADLRDFATVLKNRPAGDVHYGWGDIYVNDIVREVMFEIQWYDRSFFERRKDAYKSILHEKVLQNFGLAPADLHVVHPDNGTTTATGKTLASLPTSLKPARRRAT